MEDKLKQCGEIILECLSYLTVEEQKDLARFFVPEVEQWIIPFVVYVIIKSKRYIIMKSLVILSAVLVQVDHAVEVGTKLAMSSKDTLDEIVQSSDHEYRKKPKKKVGMKLSKALQMVIVNWIESSFF